MKILTTILLLLFVPTVMAQNYSIDWYVIGSGGGTAESDNYHINGTIGQPIVGRTSSANYTIEAGFWVGAATGPSDYEYIPGDANMYAGAWPPAATGQDVTYLVNYFRSITTSAACYLFNPNAPESLQYFWASADCNGDCKIIGSDVTCLVNYFRGLIHEVAWCEWYPPAWPPVPGTEPSGWPNCETPVSSRTIAVEGVNR